jgi:uncharacterized protein
MNERNGYPAGVTCWVDTEQPNPEAATEFYGGLFGWEFEDRMPADQPGHYFVGRLRGLDVAAIGSRPTGATWPPTWNTYVWVDSADESAVAAKRAGGAVMADPFDVGEAGRVATIADPQGAAVKLWEARGHRGAIVVNEANAWSFSGLTTPDPEGALDFYRSVFGWEADLSDGGHAFFRVPGYGDTALLMANGQPEPTPNWSVTFTVDDVDAATASAFDLGGTVVVEPFDAPPVRTAILSDPAGAVFSIAS